MEELDMNHELRGSAIDHQLANLEMGILDCLHRHSTENGVDKPEAARELAKWFQKSINDKQTEIEQLRGELHNALSSPPLSEWKEEPLPTFDEANARITANKGTPLDAFIYENEPAGAVSSSMFREQLAELIEFVRSTPQRKGRDE